MGNALLWPQTRSTGPWIWGRGVDLFWITGGGFFAFLLVVVPLCKVEGAANAVTVLFLHLSILCNYPHYTATYQLLLQEGKGRQLVATSLIMLCVLLVAGRHEEALWSLVMRLYLSLSAHHYASQHFGIAMMYTHRSGSPVSPDEKRLMQWSFLGLGMFMILVTNTTLGSISGTAIGGALFESGHVPTAAFPPSVYRAALVLCVACFWAFGRLAWRYRTRTGTHLPLTVFCLFATNAAWFAIPGIVLPSGAPLVPPNLSVFVVGATPFFHCAQYLFVTFDRNRQTHPTRPIWLYTGLVVTGFALFHAPLPILPSILALESLRSALLLVAIINIHHFWIDGLIWRKRAGRRTAGT